MHVAVRACRRTYASTYICLYVHVPVRVSVRVFDVFACYRVCVFAFYFYVHCLIFFAGEEPESTVLPPLFLTEFSLDISQLMFMPNVDEFHDSLGDVIIKYILCYTCMYCSGGQH